MSSKHSNSKLDMSIQCEEGWHCAAVWGFAVFDLSQSEIRSVPTVPTVTLTQEIRPSFCSSVDYRNATCVKLTFGFGEKIRSLIFFFPELETSAKRTAFLDNTNRLPSLDFRERLH